MGLQLDLMRSHGKAAKFFMMKCLVRNVLKCSRVKLLYLPNRQSHEGTMGTWADMGNDGQPWATTCNHGQPCATMRNHGNHGPPWATMGIHGQPWVVIKCIIGAQGSHGHPWDSDLSWDPFSTRGNSSNLFWAPIESRKTIHGHSWALMITLWVCTP